MHATIEIEMNDSGTLQDCDILMLDMDGTLLDLAFDTYMWLQHIPGAYASAKDIEFSEARQRLYEHYLRLQGKLDWYCLDHWSERLDLDILGLHREQRDRIGWLQGAEEFLQRVSDSGLRVIMTTNSHRDTLQLKAEMTGVDQYFDAIYTAHDFGFPKEEQPFWEALARAEDFDPARAMFVDDTETVLASAKRYGVGHLRHITRPDSSRDAKVSGDYPGITGVAEIR